MECTKCNLHKTRTNIVKGKGNKNAKIFFIGEAPGYHEDKQGEPFVGKAGKVFDQMLKSINLERKDIYLTNVIKCRPPNNRNPTDKEISICGKYLDKEIDYIKPKVIVPMGAIATKYILNKHDINFDNMKQTRGLPIIVEYTIIYPIYHPAALIYKKELQSIMQQDMEKIKKLIKSNGD